MFQLNTFQIQQLNLTGKDEHKKQHTIHGKRTTRRRMRIRLNNKNDQILNQQQVKRNNDTYVCRLFNGTNHFDAIKLSD